MITAESTLTEIAFVVCTALDRVGVTAVLSGGGAATFHAPDAIQSYDLDFILEVYVEGDDSGLVLEELGYRRVGHDYVHAVSQFQLEFPRGPLAVGDERLTTWDTERVRDQLLHVISPTDSCRDRLAAFYHFEDRSSLEQAVAVWSAKRDRIDLRVIEAWSEREGMRDGFAAFRRACER